MTILKNIVVSGAILLSLTGISNIAIAADTKEPAAIKATKSDATSAKIDDSSPDGNYVFKGAAGWELTPHKFNLKNGQLVHVDNFPHNTTPPVSGITKIGDYSADGLYVFKGGDSGWQLAQHKIVSQDGKWVHTDQIPKDTATPAAPTAKQVEQDRQISPGA